MREEDANYQSLAEHRVMYRDYWRVLGNVLTATLGSLYFGYCMAYITSIPLSQIIQYYSSPFSSRTTYQGILSGIIPVGAILGALSSYQLNQIFSRRNSFIVTAVFSIIGTLMIFIPTFPTLIIARIMQGACVGVYSATVPIFINQICPNELLGRFGALNQLFIISGILIANILAFTTPDPNNFQNYSKFTPAQWIVLIVPLMIASLQIILLSFVYKNQTPRYLLQQLKEAQALSLIRQLYKDQYCEDVLRDKKAELEMYSQEEHSVASVFSLKQATKSQKLRLLVGIDIAFLQQMCGINIAVIYGANIFATMNLNNVNEIIQKILQISLMTVQFIGCFIVSYLMGGKLGRKLLLQIGTGVSCVLSLLAAISYLCLEGISLLILVTISLLLFMFSFGFTLGPVAWLYPPEILPPSKVSLTASVNWFGAALNIILFPILRESFAKVNQSGTLFFIPAVWCGIFFFINHKYIVQTKNKTQYQINREFQRLSTKQEQFQ